MEIRINIQLDRNSGRPLYRQMYDELKRLIIEGELPPGYKMPSSRDIAKSLDIARSTATSAYDQLVADGFFQTYSGTGTFVSRELTDNGLKQRRPAGTDSEKLYPLSGYGQYLSGLKAFSQEGRLLRGGAVAFDDFPSHQWKQILLRRTRALNSSAMEYPDDASGYLPLRTAIANYLSNSRGVSCTSGQILITNGSQQALDIIARVHVQTSDKVGLEDPGYFLAQRCFAAYGADLVPLPVDNHGLITQQLDALEESPKVLYVTPSHQFPLGGTLPLSRRMVLLEWAQKTGTVLIEDDYDSEFRYGGRPLSALQGLDTAGSVIYTGSFSKVLYPSLRLGYIVVPQHLVPIYIWAKRLSDHFSPVLPQMVLADFIELGYLDKHIQKMRTLYGAKRQLLVSHIEKHFKDAVQIIGENAGLHLTVRFALPYTEEKILAAAEAAQVPFRSTKHTYIATPRPPLEFVLSYSNLSQTALNEGIAKFADALNK